MTTTKVAALVFGLALVGCDSSAPNSTIASIPNQNYSPPDLAGATASDGGSGVDLSPATSVEDMTPAPAMWDLLPACGLNGQPCCPGVAVGSYCIDAANNSTCVRSPTGIGPNVCKNLSCGLYGNLCCYHENSGIDGVCSAGTCDAPRSGGYCL